VRVACGGLEDAAGAAVKAGMRLRMALRSLAAGQGAGDGDQQPAKQLGQFRRCAVVDSLRGHVTALLNRVRLDSQLALKVHHAIRPQKGKDAMAQFRRRTGQMGLGYHRPTAGRSS